MLDEDIKFDAPAGPGHNLPPNDSQILQDLLEEKTSEIRARFDSLIAGAERAPSECDSDETAGKLGDMIKMITACHKSLETTRVSEKEPYLTLSRAVDGYFKKYTESLDAARKKVLRPLDAFLIKKAQEKRDAEIAEARRKREEADRLAREAAELEQANMIAASEDQLKAAVRMDNQAAKSERLSEAKPAEFARTRGDYGSLSTLRTSWVGRIVNKAELDLDALRPFMSEDVLQKLVNAAVKAGFRELRGASISEESTAQVK